MQSIRQKFPKLMKGITETTQYSLRLCLSTLLLAIIPCSPGPFLALPTRPLYPVRLYVSSQPHRIIHIPSTWSPSRFRGRQLMQGKVSEADETGTRTCKEKEGEEIERLRGEEERWQ